MSLSKQSSFETDLHRYYYLRLAAAYTRGKIDDPILAEDLLSRPLTDLSARECEVLFRHGRDAGLKLPRFKRSASLSRVRRAVNVLKGLQPASLLDIGVSSSGPFSIPPLGCRSPASICWVSAVPISSAVPIGIIDRLIGRLEVPTIIEANEVQYVQSE